MGGGKKEISILTKGFNSILTCPSYLQKANVVQDIFQGVIFTNIYQKKIFPCFSVIPVF